MNLARANDQHFELNVPMNLFGKDIMIEQDTENKKVKQIIFDEETEFEYSDFENLKDNDFYDRFFAGNLKN